MSGYRATNQNFGPSALLGFSVLSEVSGVFGGVLMVGRYGSGPAGHLSPCTHILYLR